MKRILSAFLILALLGSIMACGSGKEDEIGQASAQEQEKQGNQYPLTVVDQAGREITIKKMPERIVSAYYISTSLMIALDLEEKLVGMEAQAAKRPIYGKSAPQLMELPSVGSAKEFDLEGCAALSPDLVVLPLKLAGAAQTLEVLGIDVLLIDPENQEKLEETIRLVGKAANADKQAQELISFLDKQKRFLQEKLKDVEKPDVYIAGNASVLSTAGGAMYQSDLIELAGGRNIAANIEDTYWAEIDYEQLLQWDPEYIFLVSEAAYSVEDVLTDPNLAGCRAVVGQNVYQIPSDAEAWDSPVPGGILGALWMAQILHEYLLTRSECEKIVDEYYETFYGFTYSES